MTLPDTPLPDTPLSGAGPVVGVILASGLSRRLGFPKQLVPLTAPGHEEARPLIWHTTRAMLGAVPSGGVLVVAPPGELGRQVREALADLDVEVAENPQPDLGISESFRVALAALPADTGAASFALGDMPLVSAAMHRAVLDAYDSTGAPLVLARFGPGGVRAPPHLFRADLFGDFGQAGDHGPRHLIERHRTQTVWVDLPAEGLRDLDTPEDVEATRQLFARSAPENR